MSTDLNELHACEDQFIQKDPAARQSALSVSEQGLHSIAEEGVRVMKSCVVVRAATVLEGHDCRVRCWLV